MESFNKEFLEDIIIVTVNLTRVTLNEATEFIKIFDEETIKNYKKFVLDLSNCEFIDSTFLGAILVEHKKIVKESGTMNIVEPQFLATDLLSISKTLEKLNLFKDRLKALEEFNK